MAHGIEVRNASGFIQIDQTYPNPYLRYMATVTTDSVPSGHPEYNQATSRYILSVSGNDPIPAFRCSEYAYLYKIEQSGSTYTYTFLCAGAVGTQLTYYIFDTHPTSFSGYGIEVYDDSGSVVFSSDRKYLRAEGLVTSSNYENDIKGNSFTFSSGKVYAIVQSRMPWRIFTPDTFNEIHYMLAARTVPQGFGFGETVVHATSYSAPTQINDRGTGYLIVDVTDF